MKKKALSGIERELVLQYLIDGNVPVTLTPSGTKRQSESVQPLSSAVFPVALKGDKIRAD